MSMTVQFKHFPGALLEIFKSHPKLIEPFIVLSGGAEPGQPKINEDSFKNLPADVRKIMQEFQQLGGDINADMKVKIEEIYPSKASEILGIAEIKGFSLGKMFDVVHFHLTGRMTSDPDNSLLSRAIRGGDDIGPNLGYGPVTYLTIDEVSKIFLVLRDVPDEDFLNKYAAKEWNKSVTQIALKYFKELVSYYDQASQLKHAMFISGS